MNVANFVLLLGSIATVTAASAEPPTGASEPVVLSESIDPLRDYFNAHKDKHRFIAILSPT